MKTDLQEIKPELRQHLDAIKAYLQAYGGTQGTKISESFTYVDAFCDVAVRIMQKTNPSKIRSEARTQEIKYRIDAAEGRTCS